MAIVVDTDDTALDKEIEEMRARVSEMESQLSGQLAEAPAADADASEDTSSIYIGQVDYQATPQELHEHFQGCGTVKRVTILCDKYDGHPKGFAYMEFEDEDSVLKAVELNGSEFRGRQLKVTPKRINQPGKGAKKGWKGGKFGKGGMKGMMDYGGYSSWFSPYAMKGGKGKGKGRGRGTYA